MVSGNRQRLCQILLNLIGNASKFTQVGMVAISADQIQIAVTDTGIEIPATALPRIFDEFRQADSSTTQRFGRAGLGLAIAEQLAELHGGHISVTSDVDSGSTFTVHLPAG
jgi:signal transduction histidine kinase